MAVSQEQIKQFYNVKSEKWWQKDSENKIHHILHELTYPYIQSKLCNGNGKEEKNIEDLHVLDVGCGGGIATEMFAKDGATTTGIDINEKLIEVANIHASFDPTISHRLSYHAESIKQHAKTNARKYDVICITFVLAHVDDKEDFVQNCVKCLKPGGYIFFTAENQTWQSWLYYTALLHKICRALPKEYADHEKYAKLDTLKYILGKYDCQIEDVRGLYYNYWKDQYFWLPSTTSVDYVLCARKN